MAYPSDATYTAQELDDLREKVRDVLDDPQDLDPEFIMGAEAILIWLAGGKAPASAYGATHSRLAELVEQGGLK